MRVQCVHCGKQYSLRDENAGTHFKCRNCGQLSRVSPNESPYTPAEGQRAAATVQQNSSVLPVRCRTCGESYRLRTSAAGKQFKCRRCGTSTAVPPLPFVAAGLPRTRPVDENALPAAEVVSTVQNPVGPLPASADLFAEALPAASGFTLAPAGAVGRPASQPVKKRKKRKKKWWKKTARTEEASSDYNDGGIASAFAPILGIIFIFGGCALLFHVYQCFQEDRNPPRKSFGLAFMLIVGGIRMLFS